MKAYATGRVSIYLCCLFLRGFVACVHGLALLEEDAKGGLNGRKPVINLS